MKPALIAVVGMLALAGCSGSIESVTNVTQTGATLNARFACGQGEVGDYWVEHRRVGATGAWTQDGRRAYNCATATSEQRPYPVSGLSAGTSYEARVCGDLDGVVPPLCSDADGTLHAVSDDAGTRSDVTYPRFTTQAPTSGTVTLRQVDGGAGYYGRFSNPLPTSSDYFPIGVWGSYNHTPANRDLDAAAGLNLYTWVADSGYLDDIRADGRFRVLQDESSRTGVGTETAGWLLTDEIDMQQSNAAGAAAARQQLTSIRNGLPADGRARYNNYGKGVIFWNSDSDSEQYVNDFQDLVSSDIYWFTEGDACAQSQGGELLGLARNLTSAECHRAANYGAQVDRMRFLDGLDGQRKPIWNFVETGHPFDNNMNGARSIAPAELRAAVWHSIIAGARGILYFQHSFGGPCAGDHHTIRSNCEGTRPAVTAVDAQVKALAPVLNAQTVDGLVAGSPGLRTMAKWQAGKFWIFAGRTTNGGQTSNTIALPCAGNATASVDGESRTVPVTNGQLTDTFADGNAVHIYRIDGGSTCGLPTG
jgi:hypothetical protein